MGGFGKSSLAARYLAESENRKVFSLWYWADCREQGNTLQTYLVSMLERMTQGGIKAASLQKVSSRDILDLFFEQLGDRKVLCVFDNIDHYIDLETQQTIGTMNALMEKALALDHNAQFVFTSRPKLSYPSTRFLSLHVPGLGEAEAEELLRVRGAQWSPSEQRDMLSTLLRLTQGSALHLNLIATQVAKQRTTLGDLLRRIEKGDAPEAEDRILSEIWTTLKDEHKEVLRYLAELPHAETEQRVASCLSNLLNFNRFTKAIKALKSLNLVVVKRVESSSEAVELHPLVRAFIRTRFPREEQAPIVAKIIGFLDRMIARLRGSVSAAPDSVLENWTAKIEVCADNGRLLEAAETLYEIFLTMEVRGYTEEFLRLAELVFPIYSQTDNERMIQKLDEIAYTFICTLSEMGRYTEADSWLTRIGATVIGKSTRFIWLCKVRSYALWVRQDYTNAIKWASEGDRLKSTSNIDTKYDCAHNLALAQRDSGDIEPALAHFLRGEKLDAVLSAQHFDCKRGGHFYGNIGRCLQLQERLDEALVCFKKSALMLESEGAHHILMNRGWAAQWLGQVLEKKAEFGAAYVAFRRAAATWSTASPQRSREAVESAKKIADQVGDDTLLSSGDWECGEMYRSWLRR
jgi:tetratricopeptide (TPR) repeat protein